MPRASLRRPRGYLSDVEVLLHGARYRLFFIDLVRLGQELKANIDSGRSYFAEPKLRLDDE